MSTPDEPAPPAEDAAPEPFSPGPYVTPLTWLLALTSAVAVGSRGPLYWDSFGYVSQALTGRPGGLALGRPLFVLLSMAALRVHRALGGSIFGAEPALRTLWLGVSACAAPLAAAIATRLGFTPLASLLTALLVATSPALAHSSAAVLTDGPSLSASLGAVLVALWATEPERSASGGARSALVAGALWGAAMGLREQSVALGLTLALLAARAPAGRRARVGAALFLAASVVALLPVACFALRQPDYLTVARGWLGAMQRERGAHPYGLRDAGFYLLWLVALGPLALVGSALAWRRHRSALLARATGAFAVIAPATLQLLVLGMYQDISFSPRYLLPALVGALALPAALALEPWVSSRRRMSIMLLACALPVLLGAAVLRVREAPLRRAIDTTPVLLGGLTVPHLLLTGQPCGAAELWDLQRRRAEPARSFPSSQRACPGWGWPASLDARLAQARREGRAIVLDQRPGAWVGPRQQIAFGEAARWADAHPEGAREGWLLRWR